MDSYGRIARLKVETAQDRARAIIEEVGRLENKGYASPGSRLLLSFVGGTADKIDALLKRTLASAHLLTAPQLDTRLHRVVTLIPYLHQLLGFIEGSDVNRAPGQLIPTLRRYTQSIFPESELVVRSKPELNYSYQDIAKPLKDLWEAFKGTPLEQTGSLLPDLLFVLSIPAVESGRILIHGVLAHELGHALYNEREIAKDLKQIRIKEDQVKGLTKAMFENQQKQGNPTPELQLRRQVTQEISARVNGWVKELCCDAIGIRLFGPALFFAEAHLLTSFRPIDKSSPTHPAPRLRVRLMIRMLKQLYPLDKWRSELQEFSRAWDEVSAGQVVWTNSYDQVALDAIDDAALDLISDASLTATSSLECYSRERFITDVAGLVPLLLNLIPPGEIGDKSASIAAIINAGWYVYLCDFEAFRARLHAGDSDTRFAATAKLHELVLKALEISEIRTTWEEAKRDSKLGKN